MISGAAVPLALASDGSMVSPQDARSGERYRCPGCGADVVLRRGERRRAHFAHRFGESCSSESTLHRTAKQRLLEVIAEWKAGAGPRPCVSRPCARVRCDGGVTQDIPSAITSAAAEVRLADGLVADVVLYRGDVPAAVIEIVATHRVSQEKARRFTLPWMELRAQDVLERPYWWVAVQDGLQPFSCPACERRSKTHLAEVQEVQERAVAIARQLRLAMPPSPPYHYVPHTCWRCGTDMPAFVWPGGGEHSARRPPDPIPATVQHRVTEGAGDYWANCCPRCSTVQGDYYLVRGNADFARVREIAGDIDHAGAGPYDKSRP